MTEKKEDSIDIDLISKIQSELKVAKNQFNRFGNYKYRSCEDILEAVKPILKKYGLSLNIVDDIILIGNRHYVKSTATIFGNGISIFAHAYAREADERKGMDASQITGAASSYARKYALCGLLAIDDTKDADANENQTEKIECELPADLVSTLNDASNIDELKKICAAAKKELNKAQVKKLLEVYNDKKKNFEVTY